MSFKLICRFGVCAYLLTTCLGISAEEHGAKPQQSRQELTEWVQSLSSGQYRQRELMTLRLLAAGDAAIPVLEDALGMGDLETTAGVIAVLRRLAMSYDPQVQQVDLAWEVLLKASTSGSSSAASRAQLALADVREHRRLKAREVLTEAGVFIGFGQYHLASSVMSDDYHLRLPGDWRGNLGALHWLAWMHGVETVILAGERVNHDVIKLAAQIPDLKSLVIRDTKVTPEDLVSLAALNRLDHFQLVNVPAGDELIGAISKLRIRRALTLFGTDISLAGNRKLEETFPDLEIQCRGGFLGVHCSPLSPNCEVRSVAEGSAALEGGVLPGDVITKFGEYEVQAFSDLQAAIAKHPSAETPIAMQVVRFVNVAVEPTETVPGAPQDPRPTRMIRKPQTVTLTVKLKRQFP